MMLVLLQKEAGADDAEHVLVLIQGGWRSDRMPMVTRRRLGAGLNVRHADLLASLDKMVGQVGRRRPRPDHPPR